MPRVVDRDFPISLWWAVTTGEQPPLRHQTPADTSETRMPEILASLKRLIGFRPPAKHRPLSLKEELARPASQPKHANKGKLPEDNPAQTNFFDIVEASPVKEKRGRRPRRLPQRWPSDREGFLEVMTDSGKRARAHASDAGHYWRLLKRELGIPTPAQKSARLADEATLQAEVLKELGFDIRGGIRPQDIRRLQAIMSQPTGVEVDDMSSEGVIIYSSPRAMALKRAKDRHEE